MSDSLRYVAHVFLLRSRQLLRQKLLWIPLALLVLIVFAFRLLPQQELTAAVAVGVAVEDESGRPLQELLLAQSNELICFLPADRETIARNVSVSAWDCGLVIAADFDSRLQKLETDRIITLVIGPGSSVYPLVRESAAACLARLVTPYLAEKYLISRGMDPLVSLPPAERVDIQLRVLDGGVLEVEQTVQSLWSRLVLGMLSASSVLYTLLIAVDLGRWLNSPAGRMERRLRGTALCSLPRLAAALCPAAAGLSLAAFALHAGELVAELLAILAVCGAVGAVFCRGSLLWKLLPQLLPLLCPAVVLYALLPSRLPCSRLLPAAALLFLIAILPDCRFSAYGKRKAPYDANFFGQ